MMQNLGKEDEEFWSSGMTVDLITTVKGAGLIRVAPFDDILNLDKKLSIKEKAEKLRVKYILTNSIKKGDDGFHLWSTLENIEDGTTIFTTKIISPLEQTPQIVGHLANNIITSLGVSTKQDMMKAPTSNTEAYEYYLKGKYKYEKRENMEDMEIARGLLIKAIDLDNKLLVAKNLLGYTYQETGDNDKALEIYTQNLKQAEELGDKNGVSTSLYNIAGIYYNKLEFYSALDYYKILKDISEELGDKWEVAHSLINIGNCYKYTGDNENALDYYVRSLEKYKELDNKGGIVGSLLSIGEIYEKLGDYDKALEFNNRVLKIAKPMKFEDMISSALNQIGGIYFKKGDYGKAMGIYNQNLQKAEKLGDKNRIAGALKNIGGSYREIGDLDTALDYFTHSLKISEEIENKKLIAHSLLHIGEIHISKGDYKKAIDTLTRSLNTFEELEDKWLIPILRYFVGVTYHQNTNYEKAIMFLEKFLAEIETKKGEKDDWFYRANTFLFLSHKYIGKIYDVKEIHKYYEKKKEFEEFDSIILPFALYQLLEEITYLETSYNQVKEKADNLEPDVASKFLSYPIPTAIVEAWDKVTTDKN